MQQTAGQIDYRAARIENYSQPGEQQILVQVECGSSPKHKNMGLRYLRDSFMHHVNYVTKTPERISAKNKTYFFPVESLFGFKFVFFSRWKNISIGVPS